jgi:hypothetical protein
MRVALLGRTSDLVASRKRSMTESSAGFNSGSLMPLSAMTSASISVCFLRLLACIEGANHDFSNLVSAVHRACFP